MKNTISTFEDFKREYINNFIEAGHQPILIEDSDQVDIMVFNHDFCNGPVCKICHSGNCMFCGEIVPCTKSKLTQGFPGGK